MEPSEINLSETFKLYPNPASEIVYIELLNNTNDYSEKVGIYNITGKLIFQTRFENNSKITWVDTKNIPNGMYFVQI